ncbi:MAG: hypothetical protein IIY55_11315 [Blautia sp.]|nr:hypothetical protein [Blautia sp.]
MFVEDEKDYIMRMIKQMVRMLFSVILGKEYQLTELPDENKYEVSGKPLEEYLRMVDAGSVNEAENAILEGMDYGNKNEIAALVRFYEYIGEKEDSFLEEHGYSKEEAMDGLKQMAEECGYGNMLEFFLK